MINSDEIYGKVRELFPDLPKNCKKAVITLEEGCIVELEAKYYTDPPMVIPEVAIAVAYYMPENLVFETLTKTDIMVEKALGSLDAFLDRQETVLALKIDEEVRFARLSLGFPTGGWISDPLRIRHACLDGLLSSNKIREQANGGLQLYGHRGKLLWGIPST